MTAPARFMFDTVFPGRHSAHNNHANIPKFTDADIQSTRDAAYQEGLAAGRIEVADHTSKMLDQKMDILLSQILKLEQEAPREIEKLSAMAADLAFTSARALASELIAKEPEAELNHLFSECISQIKEAPHLVIRVPNTDLAALRERLEKISEIKGYEGKLVLLAEDAMREGDCKIEWADGGISRNRNDLEATISSLIASRYHAMTPPEQIEQSTQETITADTEQSAPEGTA